MTKKKTIGAIIILLFLSPFIYTLVVLAFGHVPMYLSYIFQSFKTPDKSYVLAQCNSATWSINEKDSASLGKPGTIDIGPVPARLKQDYILTGSVAGGESVTMETREYEPYPTFSIRYTSENIVAQIDKGRMDMAKNIIFIDKDLYDRMHEISGGIGGWVIVMPVDSTLSSSDFDELANCYKAHASDIATVFPIHIAAFGRLK